MLNGPTRFAPQPKCDEKNLEEARKLLGISVKDKVKNSSASKDDSHIVSKNDNTSVANTEELAKNKMSQTKKKEEILFEKECCQNFLNSNSTIPDASDIQRTTKSPMRKSGTEM